MAGKQNPQPNTGGDNIQITIGNNNKGIAAGKNIIQQSGSTLQVTADDIQQVEKLFTELKQVIEQQAPADKKAAAIERVDELAQAIKNQKPELSTFDYVKNWFTKNAPGLVGAVTSVFVNPIVGKVVEAAGVMAADVFAQRFGKI